MLTRIADFSYRRRWTVLAVWLAVLIGTTVANGAWGGQFSGSGRLEGTDSQAAYDLLGSRFPAHGGDQATVVFSVPNGTVEAHRPVIESYLRQLDALDRVTAVNDPFTTDGQISADGRVAFATADIVADDAASDSDQTEDLSSQFRGLTGPLEADGVQADFAGDWFTEGGMPATELLGLGAAAIILLLAFGSVLAAGLPLVTAIMGVGVGLSLVGLWSIVVSTADFTTQVASMMAIGVGIDYALFIVTRFREQRGHGLDPRAATLAAVTSAGRAVVFAGLTVMVSLLGMLLMRLDFLDGLAIGSASAIAVAVAAAVTLLPALLSLVGHRIRPLAVVSPAAALLGTSRQVAPPPAGVARRSTARVARGGFWFRWSRTLQRHPTFAAAAGLLVLVLLAAPAVVLRLGTADAGSDPDGTTTRRAYDELASGFGPGFNGALVLAGEPVGAGDRAGGPATVRLTQAFEQLQQQLSSREDVALVGEPNLNDAGDAAVLTVIPTTSPQDDATRSLIEDIRAEVADLDGVAIHVGGATASDADFAAVIAQRLPWFIGAVLVCSFALLLVSFRSVLVPLKAVVMNLLSIGAAYGVMVAVFQWGWLGSLIGVGEGAPIEPWAPMMLFAIVFGLSMDYEVFLLSRIRERYDATGDNSLAVADGLASTARVISAAAAIMVCVFGFFVFGDERAIKLIGLGLATAVFIDATVVRLILVPATMELLGDRNWWLPRWLERLVPHVDIEGHASPARPAPSVPPGVIATGRAAPADASARGDSSAGPVTVGPPSSR